jgi:hypothetical protein
MRWPALSRKAVALLPVALGAGLSLVAFLLPERPAHAFTHIVQPGETLAAISERFYGKIQNETLLVVANGLDQQGGVPIVPGMRLEVPAISYVQVTQKTTWKELALQLLGGEHRAHVLAEANDSKAWLFPDLNSEISVPYNLRIVATGEETIVGLAYRFQGDRKLAWQLDQYNARGGRRLERGEVVLVPLSDVTLTEEGKQAAKRAMEFGKQEIAGQAQSAQRLVEQQLPELFANVRNARYVEAVEAGTRMLSTGQLTKPQLARIHRLLLEAHAALSVVGRAAESCSAWFQFDPKAALDPVQMSPKLIAACEVAGVGAKPPEPEKKPEKKKKADVLLEEKQ